MVSMHSCHLPSLLHLLESSVPMLWSSLTVWTQEALWLLHGAGSLVRCSPSAWLLTWLRSVLPIQCLALSINGLAFLPLRNTLPIFLTSVVTSVFLETQLLTHHMHTGSHRYSPLSLSWCLTETKLWIISSRWEWQLPACSPSWLRICSRWTLKAGSTTLQPFSSWSALPASSSPSSLQPLQGQLLNLCGQITILLLAWRVKIIRPTSLL